VKLRHPWAVAVFSVAMGLLEAVVVVYLRHIAYPGGFRFPQVAFPPELLRAEILREAMSLVMLACVAWISAGHWWPRLLVFV